MLDWEQASSKSTILLTRHPHTAYTLLCYASLKMEDHITHSKILTDDSISSILIQSPHAKTH